MRAIRCKLFRALPRSKNPSIAEHEIIHFVRFQQWTLLDEKVEEFSDHYTDLLLSRINVVSKRVDEASFHVNWVGSRCTPCNISSVWHLSNDTLRLGVLRQTWMVTEELRFP